MTLIVVENVKPGLRGLLSRWMLEPSSGVFTGTLSALVRDFVWFEVCKSCGDGGAVLAHAAANEQGFQVWTWGKTRRVVEDFEGLTLMRMPD